MAEKTLQVGEVKKSSNRADFGIQVGNQKQDMCWVWPQGDHL